MTLSDTGIPEDGHNIVTLNRNRRCLKIKGKNWIPSKQVSRRGAGKFAYYLSKCSKDYFSPHSRPLSISTQHSFHSQRSCHYVDLFSSRPSNPFIIKLISEKKIIPSTTTHRAHISLSLSPPNPTGQGESNSYWDKVIFGQRLLVPLQCLYFKTTQTPRTHAQTPFTKLFSLWDIPGQPSLRGVFQTSRKKHILLTFEGC